MGIKKNMSIIGLFYYLRLFQERLLNGFSWVIGHILSTHQYPGQNMFRVKMFYLLIGLQMSNGILHNVSVNNKGLTNIIVRS